MGILNRLFGFRWSLYIVQNGNELVYAMHENSVIRIVGYVMTYFAHGSTPVQPWSIHLNFNRTHQSFELRPEHFTADGDDVSRPLLDRIQAIDPQWKVRGGEPLFVDARTKKEIKIRNRTDLRNLPSPSRHTQEPTFYSVMDEVFGRSHA